MAAFRRVGLFLRSLALVLVFVGGATSATAVVPPLAAQPQTAPHSMAATPQRAVAQVPLGEGELALMRDLLVANGLENQLCDPIGQMAGSLADVLRSEGFAAARCAGERSYESLAQGRISLSQAVDLGSDCVALDLTGNVIKSHGPELSENSAILSGRWINACFSDTSIWAQRGGTMYGNTFLTSAAQDEFLARPDIAEVLAHEYRHTLQWRLLGYGFPGAYLIAGNNACTNIFEITAELEDGGYVC